MFFRLEGEGVRVYTCGRDTGMMLIRLDEIEVSGISDGESIVSVELELSISERIATSIVVGSCTVISEIGPSVFTTFDVRVELDDPDEFLDWVIEIEFALDGRVAECLGTSELELFDEVFVCNLGELATLISIKVDIVDIETGINKSRGSGWCTDITFSNWSEFNIDFNFVILKGDQRESKTRISIEPELEGDVKTSCWDGTSKSGKTGGVTDHDIVSIIVFSGSGKFRPDVEPFSVLLINTLSTDFKFDVVNKDVSDVSGPCSGSSRRKGW